MDKEEILKLINQEIKSALDRFRQELKKEGRPEEPLRGKYDGIISLQDFIDEKKPKRRASEEMPVLAYYLREIDNRKLTEVDERMIKVAYAKTDRARPRRIKQVFADSQYFDNVPRKPGFYKLNDDGDYFVEITLKGRQKK